MLAISTISADRITNIAKCDFLPYFLPYFSSFQSFQPIMFQNTNWKLKRIKIDQLCFSPISCLSIYCQFHSVLLDCCLNKPKNASTFHRKYFLFNCSQYFCVSCGIPKFSSLLLVMVVALKGVVTITLALFVTENNPAKLIFFRAFLLLFFAAKHWIFSHRNRYLQ